MKIKSLLLAATMLAAAVVSCTKVTPADELSVKPSAALSFEATGNADVTLTVTTTAEKWEFTAPAWVVAERVEGTLVLNVEENTGAARVGRITFTAGTAEPVRVNVYQAAPVQEETPDGPKVAVTLNNKAEGDFFQLTSGSVTASVSVSIAEAVAEDIVVELALDLPYASEYAFITGDNYTAISAESVTFAATELTIAAGATESDPVAVTVDGAALNFGEGYLVPILATVKSGAASFAMDAKRVNYVVMKASAKEGKVKNALFFEVNDCNPLNALEYVLDDGKDTPFFDLVILFAANINYNALEDVVYLHNNPNVQALLDETDVYIQPLRKKGIKVQLGLLGNHDASGLCQLSDWGAREWAKEVAEAVRFYKLDGVDLDDEYSSSPDVNNHWFTYKSSAAGARLAYELKMAMKEACYWPTEISIFSYGYFSSVPTVMENGVEIDQVNFIDQVLANYYSSGYPQGSTMGKDRCSGASMELNLGSNLTMTEAKAKALADNGYGWAMWFAFDPSGTGSVDNNRSRSFQQFNEAAKGFYGCELKQPKNVYNKLGEGKYDPTPYPIN